MNYIVTLTGGIGSGKTTVSNFFSTLGIDVIDTDIISRNILTKNNIVLDKIFKKFGKKIIDKNNKINRFKLREIIFNSLLSKKWLENLLHPIIYNSALKKIKESKSLWCLFVVPLLIESNLKISYDRILVIDIPVNIQLNRTILRDKKNKKDIKNIVAFQINRKKRLSIADDIIDNSGLYKDLFPKIFFLYKFYSLLANKKMLTI